MLTRALLVCFSLVVAVPLARAQDLPQRRQQYASLARNLVPGLSDGTPAEEISLEPAVLEAKERWRVITLEGLETPDRRIKGVAKEAAEAHAKILDLAVETHDAGVLVDLALAFVLQNPLPLARSLGREASKAGERDARYSAAVQRRRASTFLLPELARELAGEPRREPTLAIDFDENWFGENLPDRVNLTNISDLDLNNCTIQM